MQSQAPVNEATQLTVNIFKKFLFDGIMLLSNNPTLGAQTARIKLEEAMYWGEQAIHAFRVQQQSQSNQPQAAPQPEAPQQDANQGQAAAQDVAPASNGESPVNQGNQPDCQAPA